MSQAVAWLIVTQRNVDRFIPSIALLMHSSAIGVFELPLGCTYSCVTN